MARVNRRLILMNIGWLPRWGYNQNMTGIGAALLPYALACGVYMVRHRERPIRPVRLAFIMAILLQTHILSTLFAVLALVPFWLVAWSVHHVVSACWGRPPSP
ncbi:hypothetical protein [Lacticaseibacillus thailandensis]|uniref:hypothetical protein n=1 Tax=Lacticaseibacillus thailandensis TaxID=381741 RepID=UPI0006D253B9|nr:hypothetical protein [Lacticaseibacillus thailandensis]